MKVDNIDEKILQLLAQDARTNISVLASKCGLTSSAVLRRIIKMEREGVIIGTELHLRKGTLGYPYQATIGINAETSSLDQIAEAIKVQPNVVVYCKSVGMYNMFCLPIARTTDELDSVVQRIRNIDGVQGIAINIWVEEPFVKGQCGQPKNNPDVQIDPIDLKIIEQLQNNSRTSFVEIGKTLQISHETVRKRFEAMRQNGVIRSCSITVDWSKLGYNGTLFIMVSLGHGSDKAQVCTQLARIPEISMVVKVMGAYDIQAHAKVHDLKEYAKLADEIQRIPGIRRAVVCFASFTYFYFLQKPRGLIKCDTLELSE
jgi:Lrp/AsnC family transcriptional regulator, regulator for asnA, asnC and gidA